MISPFEFKTTRKILFAVGLIAAFVGQQEIATAQQAADGASAKAQYEAALLKGRDLAKACRNVSLRFFDSSRSDSRQWEKQWPTVTKDLADHKPVLEKAAVNWFMQCKKPDSDLLQLMSLISSQLYESGDLETTWKVLQKVKQFYPDKNDIMFERLLALVAVKTNRYEYALKFLENPDAKEAIKKLEDQMDKNMFMACPILMPKWQREKELREKEAEADDLPRVKFQLTTGEVIVELFENEAPQTVANFIKVVESGHYDGSYCHPHVKDIVMQSGMANRSHNIPIEYAIKNESRKPDSRDHFTGSLTMGSYPGTDRTSASVFAITLTPNPSLDWDRTEEDKDSQPVFGRVVSGMKYIRATPVTMEIDEETEEQKPIKGISPAYIKSATVIRKRDHEYTFEKIGRPKR